MIPDNLRRAILAVAVAGAVPMAAVMGNWFEGTVRTTYSDTGGLHTVCTGHLGGEPGRTYTPAECAAFHKADLAIADKAVSHLVKVSISEYERAALIDFTFNQGAGALAGSTLLKKLNAGDHDGACNEYHKWVKGRVNGKLVTLQNQVNRREVATWLCSMH
jgi:lysozyme